MKSKVYCPVCRVSFISQEELSRGSVLLCPVCGAKLEVTETGSGVSARRYPQGPEQEIRERVDTYARLKGYVFNENKEPVLEGLLQKNESYGDFYCPCRFDNIPENICPCLETRQGQVRKEGSCL